MIDNKAVIYALSKAIAQPAPTTEAWHPTESAIAALKRFQETCSDGEGYDVPKETMYVLSSIGLIYKSRRAKYCITDFGNSVLASAIAQSVEPHDLQKRLEALDFYEDIAEHYAKCAISPEALRDWVAERMNMPTIAQPVDPDDLTIAYMSGLADGKKAAQEKELK